MLFAFTGVEGKLTSFGGGVEGLSAEIGTVLGCSFTGSGSVATVLGAATVVSVVVSMDAGSMSFAEDSSTLSSGAASTVSSFSAIGRTAAGTSGVSSTGASTLSYIIITFHLRTYAINKRTYHDLFTLVNLRCGCDGSDLGNLHE